MAGADNANGAGGEAVMGGMRLLKIVTIAMAVLIVLATSALVVVIARRLGGAGGTAAPIAVLLDEPRGTRIAGIANAGERLAVQLQGGGPDRVLLIDARTGATAGRLSLRE